jgi:hypothetical protein
MLGKVAMGESGGVEIEGEDGGIGEVEEKLQRTGDFGGLGPLGGALQPLEGLLDTHFFGGMVETPDKLQDDFIKKKGKGTSLRWSRQES